VGAQVPGDDDLLAGCRFFITWFCQFYGTTGWIAQSEKDDKATGLIKYGNILYSNQPDWMRERHPLKRGDYGTAHRIDWANGSWFKALPQGERQLASEHPYGYSSDEMVFAHANLGSLLIVRVKNSVRPSHLFEHSLRSFHQ
jgi:hypothetical protein